MEDKRNFVSMRNKGNHHGRKADIQWTLSIRGGGLTHSISFGVLTHSPFEYETTSPLMKKKIPGKSIDI